MSTYSDLDPATSSAQHNQKGMHAGRLVDSAVRPMPCNIAHNQGASFPYICVWQGALLDAMESMAGTSALLTHVISVIEREHQPIPTQYLLPTWPFLNAWSR